MADLGLLVLGAIVFLVIISGIRVIQQYERAVRLRFGKYKDTLKPGLKWIIPMVDNIRRMDIRQLIIDLKPQEVLSKDNVNLKIDGVVFFTVEEPEKAYLNVENIERQLEAKATSELKDIIGSMSMQDSLTKRDFIGKELMTRLNEAINDDKSAGPKKDWGIVVKTVQINNIELPESLVRAMAKQAEAEREKEARLTKATGEKDAAKQFAEAAIIFKSNPEALRLRELQTYQEIGAEQNSLMIVIPSTMDSKWTLPLGKDLMDK